MFFSSSKCLTVIIVKFFVFLITFTGNGFVDSEENKLIVKLRNVECNVLEFNITTIVCVTGSRDMTNPPIRVRSNNIWYPESLRFMYTAELTPVISEIQPQSG